MESIPSNRILEFNTDQLKLVRKQYNLDKPGDMTKAIELLEEWIKLQEHFNKKELPRNFLEKSILASKGSLERAKQKLDKICTFRTMMPDFFGENLTKNKFGDILDVFKVTLLPKPTEENYRVYFVKNIGSTFTPGQILNLFRYAILICEYILANDYSDGVIIVNDYNDANMFEILKSLNVMQLRQIITIITEGYGMRLQGIHLLTPSKAIDTLVGIIKQLMSPKLGKRIYVHKDISTVYPYVPKDILPNEYGGKAKSVVNLCEKQANHPYSGYNLKVLGDSVVNRDAESQFLEGLKAGAQYIDLTQVENTSQDNNNDLISELTTKDFINYLEDMNNAKVDESYRPTGTFNEEYLGMPGSFRSLNVD